MSNDTSTNNTIIFIDPLLPSCVNGTLDASDFDESSAASFDPTSWDYYRVSVFFCQHCAIHALWAQGIHFSTAMGAFSVHLHARSSWAEEHPYPS